VSRSFAEANLVIVGEALIEHPIGGAWRSENGTKVGQLLIVSNQAPKLSESKIDLPT
jgi:hypothetical protein